MFKKTRKMAAPYLSNPEYWNDKLRQVFSERDIEIVDAYVHEKKTLKELGSTHGVSGARVAQIVHQSLFFILEARTEEKEGLPMDETISKEKRMGIPMSKEEFNTVKELQFRGEEVKNVVHQIDRTRLLVDMAFKSETFEQFQAMRTDYWRKVKLRKRQRESGNILVEQSAPENHYEVLDSAQDRFNKVLIAFITEEIAIRHKDLIEENARLSDKVRELETETTKQKSHSFVTMLGKALTEKKREE